MQLQDFAQVVRSKNAGPRRFTLDLIFRNDADYQRVAQSDALTAEKIAPLYGVATDTIKVIYYPLGRAINVSAFGLLQDVYRDHDATPNSRFSCECL